MKIKLCAVVIIIAALFFVGEFYDAKAADAATPADNELSDNIEDIADNLDLSAIEEFIASLTDEQRAFLGGASVKEFIKKIIAGDAVDFGSVVSFALSAVGANLNLYIPLMLALIAVAIAYNVINSIKGKFASESVESIVRFACMGVVLVLLVTQVFFLVKSVTDMLGSLKRQADMFFPLLLTLMTAIGAGSSVNVYRPAVLIFASGIVNLITVIAVPLFLISLIFTAVGNLSSAVKLKEMSSFFSTVSKWILNTAFFLFMGFLSIQGITASVYDGISIRTTKFALSKYVPVIGGYLSEGFNLIIAGSVLIKNSLGLTAVILLLLTILPHVIQIALLSLTLRLTAAIAEPLGNNEISGVISGFGKNLNLLISMILGVGFLYFVFIMLIIATGNLSL